MKFAFLTGTILPATYAYEDETGILAVHLGATDSGQQGTVELSDYGGGIVLLHSSGGAISGIEIVVWPEIASADLRAPHITATGSVTFPGAGGEMECDVVCRVNADGSMLHLAVEDGFAVHTVRIADQVLVDLDEDGELAGLWLLRLPEGISAAV